MDITCIRIVDFNMCLYKTKVLSTIELLGDNWRIVGMFFYEYWFMSPRGIFTHVEIILQLLDCLGQVYAGFVIG